MDRGGLRDQQAGCGLVPAIASGFALAGELMERLAALNDPPTPSAAKGFPTLVVAVVRK